jgi:hypothetical protein
LLLPEKQTAEAYRPSKKQCRTLHNNLLPLLIESGNITGTGEIVIYFESVL